VNEDEALVFISTLLNGVPQGLCIVLGRIDAQF
jgi:hypothetical protein